MAEMKIKAIAPWFGAKRNLAPVIVDLIGLHKAYWEPFCGSMAVLMKKPPCQLETVNDLNGDIINLARVIQDKELAFRLYDKLRRTLCAERFFLESKERWISDSKDNTEPDVDRAYDFFVVSWMGINGISGTQRCNYQFALRWCVGGGQGATRWANVVNSMPAWHERLRNVMIIQKDAFWLLENIRDEPATVIYADPPYFDKNGKYIHDFEDKDHIRLAGLLGRFKHTRVIVSYYDHPKLEELYPGWYRPYIGTTRQSLRNATKGKKSPAPGKSRKNVEVLLVNKKPNEHGLFESGGLKYGKVWQKTS